jgi:hypothetical protein
VRAFWEPVVEPLLDAASPKVVVEIGTSHGDTTRNLLEFAVSRECTVHTIDPSPGERFDVEELRARYGDRLVVHGDTSLGALPKIQAIEAVLVDGDHNWYTVYSELRLLDERAAAEGRPFPLAFLHDVDWPYGRRDLYYDPATIPEEHRQPFEQAGMIPGRSELASEAGVNPLAYHAVAEGTPRNGVRTAVEDFLAETGRALRSHDVPGMNGLTVLADEALLADRPRLSDELERLGSAEWLAEHCRRIEHARVWGQTLANADLARVRARARERQRELRARCEALERELERLRDRAAQRERAPENT